MRSRRTSAKTGSIAVATRTTARTLWSLPWQSWHTSRFGIGWWSVKYDRPSRVSSDSCVCWVASARVNSGPLIAGPGSRCIFARLSRTSCARPAVRATSVAVVRSVKASTPFRR